MATAHHFTAALCARSDLNDDNDHFAHYCMNISLPMRILWICKALQLHYLSGILAGLPTALG